MTFGAARKEADAIVAEVRSLPAGMVPWVGMPDPSKVLLAHHDPLARLRLLRSGTTFLATGEVPTVADPFGDTLLSRRESGKVILWRVGNDGTNQNGRGSWEGGPDIVLEIPRQRGTPK